MMRLKIAALWIACQLIFFAAWALWEESYLADESSQSVLVQVAPSSPRELLRGRYLDLTYDFSHPTGALASAASRPSGSAVWVVLKKEGQYHTPKSALDQRPDALAPGEVVLKGHLDSGPRILYGIERCFVPERTEPPNPEDLSVRLRIDARGKARIGQIYLKGIPWP